jgi:hypothetical protein
MRFPDEDQTCLLINNVDKLTTWLETNNRTDLELVYWIPKYILKYILLQDNKPFSLLGQMPSKLRALAESQDKIGLRKFT